MKFEYSFFGLKGGIRETRTQKVQGSLKRLLCRNGRNGRRAQLKGEGTEEPRHVRQ